MASWLKSTQRNYTGHHSCMLYLDCSHDGAQRGQFSISGCQSITKGKTFQVVLGYTATKGMNKKHCLISSEHYSGTWAPLPGYRKCSVRKFATCLSHLHECEAASPPFALYYCTETITACITLDTTYADNEWQAECFTILKVQTQDSVKQGARISY